MSSVDYGLKFEEWICHVVPKQLNLSATKGVAMKMKFGQFADTVRPLVEKTPEEFERFFKALQENFSAVEGWRASKGTKPIKDDGKGNRYYLFAGDHK